MKVMPLAPTAVTLSWNTFGNAGTETSEPSNANDPNVGTSNLTLGAGVTAASNANRFGGSGWFDSGNTVSGNTIAEAIAGNNYIQFIVTPNAGFSFTPTSFVFNWDKSGTGPQNVALRSSADGFASNLGTVAPTAAIATQNTITITGLSDITAPTTFRIYGYGATATGGTGGFDITSSVANVILNGTTAASGGTPTKLAITNISPTSPSAGSGFSVTVQAQDAGNVAANVAANTDFTLSNTGGGAIGGTTTGTIAAGTNSVTVTGVTLSSAATGATLTATRTAGDTLTPGTSAAFDILAAADQIAFVGVPATGAVNGPLSTFTVEARRPDNSVDTSYTGNIVISKATGTGNLTGTLTKAAVAGVATFNDLQFDAADTYTLNANSGAFADRERKHCRYRLDTCD
ncbi:MAG: hypothetical protein IPG67_01325 [Acidobacteria bacterium]|nr:hypothetical protein [Acidobacteriota bacterium]